MLQMKPDIRALWTAALRSGEYSQGKSKLNMFDPVKNVRRFCCMGVLCDLAVEADVVTSAEYNGIVSYGAAANSGTLPDEVRQWAGLDHRADPVLEGSSGMTCSGANDMREMSFGEIADLIDGGPDASS